MHESIKAFSIKGEMKDGNIIRAREHFQHTVETMMRDEGYVPVLDLEPHFTLDYSEGLEVFRFHLTVYGARVEGPAWHIAGVMNGKIIPKYTQSGKSRRS